MNAIKTAWLFLTRTSSKDPEEVRNEYVLLVILTSMSIISIPSTIIVLFLKSIPTDTFIIFSLIDVFLIFGWFIVKHSRLKRFSRYIPLILFFLTALYGNYIGGIGAPTILLYVLTIIVTSLLFSRKFHTGIIVLSILSYFILGMLHYKGVIISVRDDSSAFYNRVLIAIAAIIGIGVLQRLIINQLINALKISGTREEELQKEIEQHRNTEKAFRESEERYRTAIEGANDGVAILENNVHIYVNQQFLKMFGYNNLEETIGLPPFFTVHPDDREWVATIASARQLGEDTPHKYDFKGIQKDGTIIYVEVSVNLILYQGKNAILIYFRDITERKQIEEALRISESQMKAIVDGSPIPQFVIGKDHRIIHWNRALEEYCGIKSEDIIGTNQHWRAFYSKKRPCMADLIVDGSIDLISQWYADKYNKSQLINNAYEATDFFNTIRGGTWLYFTAAPIYGDDGSVVGAVETLVDVTDQRIAEKSLGESEQKFRILFENAPFGMVMISQNGTFNYINRKFREIFGYELEEIPDGRTWFKKVFPDAVLRHKVISEWKEDLEKYKVGEKRQRIYTAICKDGSSRIINFIPVLLATGDNLMACEDITDRKQAEDEKDALQAQLVQAQKMESVGRLAGGVAHDFNNMLGVILGYTELAGEEIEHIQPISSYLDEIRKAAQRSTDLTRQLLAFARKQTIAPKVLDLNETIDGMLKILRRLIGEDIDLVWMPEGNLWQVKIDPSQVDQLLANLCVNARDAIAGIGKVTIETENIAFDEEYCDVNRGFIPGEYVMLAVSDDGVGMEKDILNHLFEPFFTTKDFGKGTGLGLATVYGIIKQNNGFIKVYSESGKGSTFKIYIPRFIGEAEKPESTSQINLLKGQGEIVLLVEDDASMLKVIGEMLKMLKMLNYKVLSADSPDEAINLAKNNKADIKLLITDVVMPAMNGRELEKLLIDIIPGLKCLFASGYTANVIAHHGVLNKGVNFIQKPFSKQALATKVREVLNSKK